MCSIIRWDNWFCFVLYIHIIEYDHRKEMQLFRSTVEIIWTWLKISISVNDMYIYVREIYKINFCAKRWKWIIVWCWLPPFSRYSSEYKWLLNAISWHRSFINSHPHKSPRHWRDVSHSESMFDTDYGAMCGWFMTHCIYDDNDHIKTALKKADVTPVR